MAVPGIFAGFPLSPALLTWSLAKVGGSTYVLTFRGGLPHDAAGVEKLLEHLCTWQLPECAEVLEPPVLHARAIPLQPRELTRHRAFPNGLYEVTVDVSDMRGNNSEAACSSRSRTRRHPLFASRAELGTVSPAVDPLQLLDANDVRTRLRELDALAGAAPPVDVVLPCVVGSEGVALVVVLQQQVA